MDYLYGLAVKLTQDLAEDVIQDCKSFAERNDFELEWVLDRFRVELNKKIHKLLNE